MSLFSKRHESFWLEKPIVLLKNITLIPKEHMTLEEKMNCVTRLIIFTYLVLHLVGYRQALLFLILSIIFIIILYYLQKSIIDKDRMTSIEHFDFPSKTNTNSTYYQTENSVRDVNTYIQESKNLYEQGRNNNLVNRYTFDKYPSYFTQQVETPVTITPDQSFKSNSQSLVGPANPKTRIAPVVAPPVYEWHYWKKDDFVVPNMINDKPSRDYYGSGYLVSKDPTPKRQANDTMYRSNKTMSKNNPILNNANIDLPLLDPENKTDKKKTTVENFTYLSKLEDYDDNDIVENFTYIDQPVTEKKKCNSCTMPSPTPSQRERTNGDFKKFDTKKQEGKNVRYTGDVNDQFAYDETNMKYGLPTNYAASNCQRKNEVASVNDQIFTSTVVPGVYYRNQVIEPIDSNIGISFTQQIPPRMVSEDDKGDIIYTGMDPKLYKPVNEPEQRIDVPSTYDVYDPRFNGYGTSYRGYTDKMTGRPRFFYDDVDAIRRPNYITRTEIDHLKGVDTYGPIRSNADVELSNDEIRVKAENAFSDQTLDFRTDMMTRLMRKANAQAWQQRMAPITRMKK